MDLITEIDCAGSRASCLVVPGRPRARPVRAGEPAVVGHARVVLVGGVAGVPLGLAVPAVVPV